MKNEIIYILLLFTIVLVVISTNSLAITPFGLLYGVIQSGKYALTASNEITLSMDVAQDSTNPKKININVQDTAYKIETIKWIEGYIADDNVEIFNTESVNTIQIEAEQETISTSFEVENYGQYTVYAKNSHGDYFLTRIKIGSSGAPTITITKDETNKRHMTIFIESNGDDIITSLKVAKVEAIKDEVDFNTQGTNITITEGKNVTVDYTFVEDGIYKLQATDTSGNTVTQNVYAYYEFPVNIETVISDKKINITANATLSNVNSIAIRNDETSQENTLQITPAKTVTTEYDAEAYGTYIIIVKDEIGFTKEMKILLKEQQEQAPVITFTYTPTAKTNGPVEATVTFDKQGVTITNNEGKNTYKFAQNGSFDFEYQTTGGLTGKATATVNWIEPITIENQYSVLTEQNINYLRKIPEATTVQNLITSINIIDAEYKITDSLGNAIKQEAKLATSMKLKGDKEYTIVITGDINGDGIMSATDVSLLKLHLIDATALTGENYYAADMNMDNALTLTDLSQIKTKLVE